MKRVCNHDSDILSFQTYLANKNELVEVETRGASKMKKKKKQHKLVLVVV